jgi:site-specific DNA-methyltransferase (adenine-specific)
VEETPVPKAKADPTKIAASLLDRAVAIDRLVPHPKNARTRSKRAEEELELSLRLNGQYKTVITRPLPGSTTGELQLLVGHGTVEMARRLGWTRVAADVHEGLSEEEAARIVAVDNRTNDLAGYDWEKVLELVDAAGGLEGTGYDLADIRDIAAGLEADLVGGHVDPDEAPELPRVPLSRRGDLWALGNHRLLCADATDPAAWDQLVGEDSCIDLLVTDPPYGVSYTGGPMADRSGILNDELGAEELRTLLTATLTNARERLIPGRGFYICSPSGPLEEVFRQAIRAAGLGLRQQLVWVKDRHVLGRQDYHLRHESLLYGWADNGLPIPVPETEPDLEQLLAAVYADGHETMLYGWRDGARHEFRGGRKQNSVWEIPRPSRSSIHPTMKPIALVLRALQNSSIAGDLVCDPFAGSGTIAIAAEQSHRRAHMLELDPGYVDVIALRWQRFTGKRPELIAQLPSGDASADTERLGEWDLVELRAEEDAAS